jgi:tetratricopeptide (TPR) repeat protein
MSGIATDLVAMMRWEREQERSLGSAAMDIVRLATYTRGVQLASLEAYDRGEVVSSCDERGHAVILGELPDRSWPEVEREADEILDPLVARVERLSVTELLAETPWNEVGEPPLWRQLLGNCLWHPLTTILVYLRDEDLERAIEMSRDLLARVRASSLPAPAEGGAAYNLACLYAGCGRTGEALELLTDALRLNPRLVEWSRKDADLDPLRAEPAFAAIAG